MGLNAPSLENVLPGLAGPILEAARLAERAAGTSLEAAALSLFGGLLDAAKGIAGDAAADPGGDLAVALALVGSAVLQGRAVLACRELTAEGLDAARRRGDGEGYDRGYRAGLRAAGRPARAAARRGTGRGALRAVG